MLGSYLLQISTTLSSAYQTSHDFATNYVPVMESDIVFAASFASIIALPLLYFIIFSERNSKLPPRFNYLVPMILGKFDLKREGPVKLLTEGYKQCGDCYRFKIGPQGFTVFIGPDANAFFFETSDKEFTQKEVYHFTVPVFGKNIVYDADPNTMLQQLKFVRHGLNGQSMRAHALKILRETKDYFDSWGDEGEIDLKEALSELTILTASRCLLGAEVREKLHAQVAHQYQYLNDGMTHLSVLFPNLPTKAHRLRDQARKEIVRIFKPIIAERRENAKKGLPPQDDYLQVLIDAKYRDDSSPTDDEIVGLLLAALFAGQHTSNITSTWMGLQIVANKEKLLPRLLEEQRQVLGTTNGELTFEALAQMDLLHNCMKETLRLYPPIVVMLRKVQSDQTYGNFTVPKGDIVVSSPSVSHRLPEVWTNPDKFDPDRYSPERNEGSHKHAFIAFGLGRHTCLGKDFAYLQVKTIWSILLRQYDFDLVTKPLSAEIDYSSMVAGPKGDCRVRYKRRKDAF